MEPRRVFAAAGVRRPDGETRARVRQAIVDDPDRWREVVGAAPFARLYRLGGESLKRVPGLGAAHPLVDDLRRKDFIAVAELAERDAIRAGFLERYAETSRSAAAFVAFLCRAIDAPF